MTVYCPHDTQKPLIEHTNKHTISSRYQANPNSSARRKTANQNTPFTIVAARQQNHFSSLHQQNLILRHIWHNFPFPFPKISTPRSHKKSSLKPPNTKIHISNKAENSQNSYLHHSFKKIYVTENFFPPFQSVSSFKPNPTDSTDNNQPLPQIGNHHPTKKY